MERLTKVNLKRIIMGRLTYGCDLLDELTQICEKEQVRLGRLEAIGAVQSARLGFYDQADHKYAFVTLNQPLEVVSLLGNVSIKDGKPFVHAHILLADQSGRSYGGHLAPGTIIFAGEFVLMEFAGPDMIRTPDQQTGLQLW
ncbi:MAG: DNA-binding protein [Kiritimatiellae bacterium]|nr:DNA-binding protein [Kiritimatiellia bacterium]